MIPRLLATTLTTAAALLFIAPAAAFAADGDVYDGDGAREGFTLGVSLGAGNLSCEADGCEDDVIEAGSFAFHLGAMADDDVALLFDLWWMVHDEDRVTISQGIMTAAIQFWPIDRLWLRGGVGGARLSFNYDGSLIDVEDHSEWVPALQLAVGAELVSTETFALDLALRYGTGVYADGDYEIHNGALTLGLNWF